MAFLAIREALRQGVEILERGGIPIPRLTAEVLLCHALGRDRSYLYTHPERELREIEWIHYGRYLNERLDGKPTQYITRSQEFYGRAFLVTPDVLIPRPETEHVVEAALRFTPRRAGDIGCGSGAIAVTLAIESPAEVWATDLSLPALAVASRNAATLGAKVRFVACDLASALAPASFDLVASNPPYVPEHELPGLQREVRDFEPRLALLGGPTGFEVYARLIACAARILKPAGRLVMELGYNSAGRVQELLQDRFEEIAFTSDLAGYPRVVSGRVKP